MFVFCFKVGLELLGAFIEEPYDVGEETHNSDAAYRYLWLYCSVLKNEDMINFSKISLCIFPH